MAVTIDSIAASRKMGFIAAMYNYFGLNGKTRVEFNNEIKMLTDEDKAEFKKMLATVGYDCD